MNSSLHSFGFGKLTVSSRGRNPFLRRWEEIFSSRREQPAVLGSNGEVLRTFGEIERFSGGWAETLAKRNSCGVVSLVAHNTSFWPEVLLGAWKADWGVVPLEASMPEKEVQKIELLTGCHARISGDDDKGRIFALHEKTGEPPLVADVFKVTSGTSSERRTVLFNASQLLADAENVCASMGIRDSDRNLGLIPFAHSYGLTNLIGMLLGFGVPLVIGVDAMPRAIAAAIQTTGATVLPGVPTIFRTLGVLNDLPDSLRLCISAGALLSASDAQAFHAAFTLKVHSFYGASECGGICYDASEEVEVLEGFVGTPLSGVVFSEKISDAGIHPEIQGPAVGLAYHPSRAGDALDGGMFRPPDILDRVRGGFQIVGRESDFINVGGQKVNPMEIEKVLRSHPEVLNAVVFAGPGTGRGECVAACIVASVGEGTLRAHCAERLPAWQIPRAWLFVESIPVSNRGKLSRSALKMMFFGAQGTPSRSGKSGS